MQIVKVNTSLDVTLDENDIFDSIANGSSLVKYCRERNLAFGETFRWINADPHRKAGYKEAIELRKEWAAQAICDALMTIAQFDPALVFYTDEDGIRRMHPVEKWPPECRFALESFEWDDERGVVKPKFAPKLKALELIGKTYGIFADKVEVGSQGETLAEIVAKAAKGNYGSDGKAAKVED